MNDLEPRVVVVKKKKQGYGRYWPLWIQIGSFVSILICFAIVKTILKIYKDADFISIAEIMAVLGAFAAFLIAFIIGIIGAISFGKKSEELGNLRMLTLVLSILNLIIGACAIGFVIVLFIGILSGMHV